MNAIGLTILRSESRVDSFHVEARPSGVVVVSNDRFEVSIQVDERGQCLCVSTTCLGNLRRQPAFASVVLAVGKTVEVTCE